MENKVRLDNCNFVKTVLMLVIVFYHSILFWSGNWFTENPIYEAEPLSLLAKWLNCFHLYAFALVSGYIYYHARHEAGKYQKYFSFLKSKAKRLLIPYIVVGLVWAMPAKLLWQGTDFAMTFLGYISGASPSQLWFLLMLFNVFAIVYPLSSRIEQKGVLAGVLATVLYFVGVVGATVFPNVLQIWNTCKFLLFFLLGYKLRQHGTNVLMKIPCVLWIFCSFSLFALNQFLAVSDSTLIILLAEAVSFVCKIVSAVMVFILLQKIADKSPTKCAWLVKLFGNRTMAIYLFHQQIIYIFIVAFNGLLNPYLNATINFLGSLIISAIIAAVLMKFKATRFLIGEK